MDSAQTQRPFYSGLLGGKDMSDNNQVLPLPTTPISSEILALLGQQTDNFISLQHLSKTQDYNPAAIFLAQTLTYIEGEMGRNPSLVAECMTYLDMMAVYSLTTSGQPSHLFDSMVDVIIHSRTVPSDELEGKVLALTALSDFLFDGSDALRTFLNHNKYLVAMYTYTLIGRISLAFHEEE
ncbi:hypothetical protein AGENTSMITH_8 [Bacillus phage vB_BspM_AgentSmith]|nr:hypothetical protein AGENTSMITH_8 [Bacillus phage vB_BspM_AgentSmith]